MKRQTFILAASIFRFNCQRAKSFYKILYWDSYRQCLPQAQAIQHDDWGLIGLLKPRARGQSTLLEIPVSSPISVWDKNRVLFPYHYNTSQQHVSQPFHYQIAGHHVKQTQETMVNHRPALKAYTYKWYRSLLYHFCSCLTSQTKSHGQLCVTEGGETYIKTGSYICEQKNLLNPKEMCFT